MSTTTTDRPRKGLLHRHEPRPRTQSRFRRWRKSRPFWGGLLTMIAGAEIALVTGTAYELILVSRSVVYAIAVGVVIAVFGLTMWLSPVLSKLLGLLTLVAALVSFVSSNLGGFLLGMVLAIVGGGLSFAWQPAPVAPGAGDDDRADRSGSADDGSADGSADDSADDDATAGLDILDPAAATPQEPVGAHSSAGG